MYTFHAWLVLVNIGKNVGEATEKPTSMLVLLFNVLCTWLREFYNQSFSAIYNNVLYTSDIANANIDKSPIVTIGVNMRNNKEIW